MPGLFFYLCLLCGADTQPVLIPVLAADLCVSLDSRAGRRGGTVFFYIYSMPVCGADTQTVLIIVPAADLCVFLVSQAGRHAGTVLYKFLLCGSDTQLGRDWRWSSGAHEDPVYRTILAKFQDNKETTPATEHWENYPLLFW